MCEYCENKMKEQGIAASLGAWNEMKDRCQELELRNEDLEGDNMRLVKQVADLTGDKRTLTILLDNYRELCHGLQVNFMEVGLS